MTYLHYVFGHLKTCLSPKCISEAGGGGCYVIMLLYVMSQDLLEGSYIAFNPFIVGIDFRRQNLTSIDVYGVCVTMQYNWLTK